jgi:uncharacterized membrane protein
MIEVHYVAGLLALVAGFVALFSRKGGRLHRRSGRLFVGAMAVMLGLAAFMALFVVDKRANGVGALLTLYLVVTSLLTVTRRVDEVRGIVAGLAAAAFALGVWGLMLALQGAQAPGHGDTPQGGIVSAAVGIGGAWGDVRMLAHGSIAGARRLVRHLWRMTFALWIATASFFLGQAKVLPPPMQKLGLLSIPVLLVLLAMIYWLARTSRQKRREESHA